MREIKAEAMPTYNNYPFGRRGMQPRPSGMPGGDQIQRLVQEYQALKAAAQQQAQLLENLQRELDGKKREFVIQQESMADLKRELGIKDEALRRQGEALKQTEAELIWARAAVQQQERAEQQQNSPEEMSWKERYARLQSELENLRRRLEQRYEADTANARQEILRDMLPLADHLEMAIQHMSATAEQSDDEQAQAYIRNLGATHQAFLNTLKRYQVTPIDAQAQPFDPHLHEAVGRVAEGDVPSGAVAQVLQTGYLQGDKLLRPARVLVRE